MKIKNFNSTYTLPFRFEIPNTIKYFLGKNSLISSRIKFFKRFLYILLNRQLSLEISKILHSHKNILWINISAPSLGDSLMDLSGRLMLKDKKIDLYTDIKNAHLYINDKYFSSVFSETKQVKKKYDLVIVDSYSTRSIYVKTKVAPSTEYVSMFGYFNGPEVNRVLFSFHQMNNLLGYKNTTDEISKIAKPSLFISKDDKFFIKNLSLPKSLIAIAVGGEWKFRTFNNWIKVIEELLQIDKNISIILIGSNNGISTSEKIIYNFSEKRILNYVSKLTFNQAAEVIRQSTITVCCDGGLMHAANSVDAVNVALLAKLDNKMQLTEINNSFPLFDFSNVNNIAIEDILKKCKKALNLAHNHLQT